MYTSVIYLIPWNAEGGGRNFENKMQTSQMVSQNESVWQVLLKLDNGKVFKYEGKGLVREELREREGGIIHLREILGISRKKIQTSQMPS